MVLNVSSTRNVPACLNQNTVCYTQRGLLARNRLDLSFPSLQVLATRAGLAMFASLFLLERSFASAVQGFGQGGEKTTSRRNLELVVTESETANAYSLHFPRTKRFVISLAWLSYI